MTKEPMLIYFQTITIPKTMKEMMKLHGTIEAMVNHPQWSRALFGGYITEDITEICRKLINTIFNKEIFKKMFEVLVLLYKVDSIHSFMSLFFVMINK